MSAPTLPTVKPMLSLHRTITLLLTVLSLSITWSVMTAISAKDPWYRNTDMNMHNMVDALALNSGIAPNPFAQPGVPLKYLLALDYRLRNAAGTLPVWTMKRFGRSTDPLAEIPRLIRIARVHSRMLVMALIIAAGGLIYSITRNLDTTCLSILLLCGSAGLLFQGLLSRPELLCVAFGNILALWCTWHATTRPRWSSKHAWLFLAGVMGGLAALEKLPGICYIVLCYGWCWLASGVRSNTATGSETSPKTPGYWSGILPAIGATSVLWLLWQLNERHDDLGSTVLTRLRLIVVCIALLPLVATCMPRRPLGSFLAERIRELSVLGGGALAALSLSYLLLRGLMDKSAAVSYMTGVLHFIVNPAPYLQDFITQDQAAYAALLSSLKDAPLLFGGAILIVLGACFRKEASVHQRAFMTLMLIGALALTYLMSKRYFTAQYTIFSQVPLLLATTLGLHLLSLGWRNKFAPKSEHWAAPLVVTAAFVLMLTSFLRVQPRYHHFQADAALPVSPLTLTFIYDHDAHVHAYREIMQKHYGSREDFALRLNQYLSDPTNRY